MRVGNKDKKRSIKFEDIREGTVFTWNSGTYIKGSGGAAMNAATGQITYPANDTTGEWDKCFIYPRASLSIE